MCVLMRRIRGAAALIVVAAAIMAASTFTVMAQTCQQHMNVCKEDYQRCVKKWDDGGKRAPTPGAWGLSPEGCKKVYDYCTTNTRGLCG